MSWDKICYFAVTNEHSLILLIWLGALLLCLPMCALCLKSRRLSRLYPCRKITCIHWYWCCAFCLESAPFPTRLFLYICCSLFRISSRLCPFSHHLCFLLQNNPSSPDESSDLLFEVASTHLVAPSSPVTQFQAPARRIVPLQLRIHIDTTTNRDDRHSLFKKRRWLFQHLCWQFRLHHLL